MLCLLFLFLCSNAFARDRWTEDQANAWFANVTSTMGYIMGSQFIVSDAGNQLEMFQADTFNPERIDYELGLAESIGATAMRVFLHDLAYSQDPKGFLSRLNTTLDIANKHGIKLLLTPFDSCWNGFPKIGKQPEPVPGVMLSSWMQSPGVDALVNQTEWPRLQAYVTGLVGAFANDDRVLGWDIWNEPDNPDYDSDQHNGMVQLLQLAFEWARSANPTQPLTSALTYVGSNYANNGHYSEVQQIQVNQSDIESFHNYSPVGDFEKNIKALQVWNRPIFCTEYMARPRGSDFIDHLPLGKRYNIGMFNWGFVNGKTQCNYPWDSWGNDYTKYQPSIWFHEIFRNDGTAYMVEEVQVIKRENGCPKGYKSTAQSSKNLTCYNAYNTPLSFSDAQEACIENYASLATIDSQAQLTELLSYVNKNFSSCNSFYFGFTKTFDGDWDWVPFGQGWFYDVSNFTNWKSGYPTNDANANCAVLNKDGSWTNQACTTPQCYICSY
jgi:hypothetical protein